jgi:ergothioneine biosynthesis protein EgtB
MGDDMMGDHVMGDHLIGDHPGEDTGGTDVLPLRAKRRGATQAGAHSRASRSAPTHAQSTSSGISERYAPVRATTEQIAAPLSAEDQTIQSMPDASPTKWHRAHTTWFFETFVLVPHAAGYRTYADRFGYLFNSYYEAVGPRHARPARGMITRPGVSEIKSYRAYVDDAMQRLLEDCPQDVVDLVELGLHHEQQHQELILTDIKHAFSLNPIGPVYIEAATSAANPPPEPTWFAFEGGIYQVGHAHKEHGSAAADRSGFAFDNEGPAHEQLVRRFRIMNRPISVGEYSAFIADGGYRRPEFWLSDGWASAQGAQWEAPAYWQRDGDRWSTFTLHGIRPLAP